jgi:phosphoribosylanthranilate isomerase
MFIAENEENIQCIVAKDELDWIQLIGEGSKSGIDTYADNVDTMKFLELFNSIFITLINKLYMKKIVLYCCFLYSAWVCTKSDQPED